LESAFVAACSRPLLAVIWPELVSAELAKLPAEQLGAPAAQALAVYKVSQSCDLGTALCAWRVL